MDSGDADVRFAVMAGFQMLGFVALSVAPVLGGLLAESFGWRSSFFGLSVIWAGLAVMGSFMHESAPDTDVESKSYFEDLRLGKGLKIKENETNL